MGDMPALATDNTPVNRIETPPPLETTVEFTRFGGYEDGRFITVPDIDGDGRGWALANAAQMYDTPKIIAQNLPAGYSSVPNLFERR